MDFRLEQLQNIEDGRLLILFGMKTDVNALQPLNVLMSRLVVESGIVNEYNMEQLLNAESPMDVIAFGSSTDCSFLQL